ncbi:GL14421 [Drosophila persimilis]|uniref:GL14421 n=1 Tax=Drosophila persimilis TaxID=7234 RepID=B4GTU2_DROPE|nr:GL14421 [Drosophila persimilis]
MSGQSRPAVRSLWRCYCSNTIGILFVVDAADFGRMSEACRVLYCLMSFNELSQCVVMVSANKQDLYGVVTADEQPNALNLVALRTGKSKGFRPTQASLSPRA